MIKLTVTILFYGSIDFYKVNNVSEIDDKVFVQSVNTIMIDATPGKVRDVAEK